MTPMPITTVADIMRSILSISPTKQISSFKSQSVSIYSIVARNQLQIFVVHA